MPSRDSVLGWPPAWSRSATGMPGSRIQHRAVGREAPLTESYYQIRMTIPAQWVVFSVTHFLAQTRYLDGRQRGQDRRRACREARCSTVQLAAKHAPVTESYYQIWMTIPPKWVVLSVTHRPAATRYLDGRLRVRGGRRACRRYPVGLCRRHRRSAGLGVLSSVAEP